MAPDNLELDWTGSNVSLGVIRSERASKLGLVRSEGLPLACAGQSVFQHATRCYQQGTDGRSLPCRFEGSGFRCCQPDLIPDVALVVERWVWWGYGDRREHDHEYVQREWYVELLNYSV